MPAAHTRFAIVTGAAAGIGKATADLLVENGWRIGAFDMDEVGLATLAAALPAEQVLPYRLDVTDEAQWAAAMAAFGAWSSGRLDLLVNNAGIIAVGRLTEVPLSRMRRLLDVNIVGVINGVRACAPLLAATRGCVVNVSSIAAFVGWPNAAAYSASKSAVSSLTEALAVELAPSGIAVCEVMPGFVATQLMGDESGITALRTSFKSLSIAFTSPGRIARAILAAAEARTRRTIVGRQNRAYAFVNRYLPGIGRLMTRRLANRYDRAIEALNVQKTPSSAKDGPDEPAA